MAVSEEKSATVSREDELASYTPVLLSVGAEPPPSYSPRDAATNPGGGGGGCLFKTQHASGYTDSSIIWFKSCVIL